MVEYGICLLSLVLTTELSRVDSCQSLMKVINSLLLWSLDKPIESNLTDHSSLTLTVLTETYISNALKGLYKLLSIILHS